MAGRNSTENSGVSGDLCATRSGSERSIRHAIQKASTGMRYSLGRCSR
jgi:hypothetical protein